jgi:hypothetical protein
VRRPGRYSRLPSACSSALCRTSSRSSSWDRTRTSPSSRRTSPRLQVCQRGLPRRAPRHRAAPRLGHHLGCGPTARRSRSTAAAPLRRRPVPVAVVGRTRLRDRDRPEVPGGAAGAGRQDPQPATQGPLAVGAGLAQAPSAVWRAPTPPRVEWMSVLRLDSDIHSTLGEGGYSAWRRVVRGSSSRRRTSCRPGWPPCWQWRTRSSTRATPPLREMSGPAWSSARTPSGWPAGLSACNPGTPRPTGCSP